MTCGDWKLDDTDTYEQSLDVIGVINHPSFNAATFENDIAVLNVYFGQPTTTEYIRF